MKILHCIDSLDPARGGPVQAVKDIASRSGRGGAEIEVLATDDEGSPWLTSWATPVHAIGRGISAYRYNPETVRWLKSQACRYDAVVSHGIWTHQAVAVHQALCQAGLPYFVYVHGMLNPWFKRNYPLKHIKKALFWSACVHATLRRARAVLFLSQEEETAARESFDLSGICPEIAPLAIRRPPVDDGHQILHFRESFPELAGRRFLLFFGRICAVKGCDALVRAFARVRDCDPECHLVMAGPDSESLSDQLKLLAVRLGIQNRVHWLGPLYGALKWGALKSADILVLPSHCEACPVAVLEALACRLPVLVTDKVNIWRAVADSNAGLIATDEVSGIAEMLRRWLQLDMPSRESFRDNALRCYERNFEIRNERDPYLNVIEKYTRATPGLVPAPVAP